VALQNLQTGVSLDPALFTPPAKTAVARSVRP
jgi:hypothetical protein